MLSTGELPEYVSVNRKAEPKMNNSIKHKVNNCNRCSIVVKLRAFVDMPVCMDIDIHTHCLGNQLFMHHELR